jgi:hypothetical protein
MAKIFISCSIMAVNALAPYVLTALMERPRRLVYPSSLK